MYICIDIVFIMFYCLCIAILLYDIATHGGDEGRVVLDPPLPGIEYGCNSPHGEFLVNMPLVKFSLQESFVWKGRLVVKHKKKNIEKIYFFLQDIENVVYL